jgi:hypothetical protein
MMKIAISLIAGTADFALPESQVSYEFNYTGNHHFFKNRLSALQQGDTGGAAGSP